MVVIILGAVFSVSDQLVFGSCVLGWSDKWVRVVLMMVSGSGVGTRMSFGPNSFCCSLNRLRLDCGPFPGKQMTVLLV